MVFRGVIGCLEVYIVLLLVTILVTLRLHGYKQEVCRGVYMVFRGVYRVFRGVIGCLEVYMALLLVIIS